MERWLEIPLVTKKSPSDPYSTRDGSKKNHFTKIPSLTLSSGICVNNQKLSSASSLSSETVGREPPRPPPHTRRHSEKWPRPSSVCRNASLAGGSPSWNFYPILKYPEEGVRFGSSPEAWTSSRWRALPSSRTPSGCLWRVPRSVGHLPSRRKRSRSRRSCWRKYHCWGRSCCQHRSNSASACGAGPAEPQTHPGAWIRHGLPCGMHAGWHWELFQRLSETTAKRGCWASWGVYSGDGGKSVPCQKKKKEKKNILCATKNVKPHTTVRNFTIYGILN